MKIAIAAPGRKVSPKEMKYAIKWMCSNDITVVYDDRLFLEDHIFAGTDDERANIIQEYMDNPDIDAIWFARGGYGSIRIIDKIDFSRFKEHPKPFIGFSDGTVFHGMAQRLGVPSIHASMPYFFKKKTPEAKQSLLDALNNKPLNYQWQAHELNRPGQAEATIVGGNLSVLYGMMGSNSFPETKNHILFIEEVDEYIYHIERMMMGLKRAGILESLAGLVIGGLSSIHDNRDPFGKTVEKAIFDTVKEYSYPVCFKFPAGHISDNRALVLGRPTSLTVSSDCSILKQ